MGNISRRMIKELYLQGIILLYGLESLLEIERIHIILAMFKNVYMGKTDGKKYKIMWRY